MRGVQAPSRKTFHSRYTKNIPIIDHHKNIHYNYNTYQQKNKYCFTSPTYCNFFFFFLVKRRDSRVSSAGLSFLAHSSRESVECIDFRLSGALPRATLARAVHPASVPALLGEPEGCFVI